MCKNIINVVVVLMLIISSRTQGEPGVEDAAIFYVAANGSDTWSGALAVPNEQKSDGPLGTIVGARNAIRKLKRDNGLHKPVKVIIRSGTYFLDDTLVFTPEDSGTESCHITYTAYPSEKPVLSGGKIIAGPWKRHKGRIKVCAVSRGKSKQWVFRQLSVDGKRQLRARIPNTGYYRIEKPVDKCAFKYEAGDFQRWDHIDEVEAVILHSWNESRLLVSELKEKDRIVRFVDANARHPVNWSGATINRYYIENVLEGLDQPGEWYLDTHTSSLYYWPTQEISGAEVIAPVLTQLMRFEGNARDNQYVEFIEFCGLTFSDSDWVLPEQGYPDCGDVGDIVEPSAIALHGARHCSLRDNCIRNVGAYAIEVNGHDNHIVGNEIHSAGSGGIISRSLQGGPNIISYNHIHHCGVVYHSAVGVNIDDGGGVVSHNLIHDMPHSGVYTRHWSTRNQPLGRRNQEQSLVIEYNEIYNMSQVLDDSGGIFVRDSNILIRNNLIHDVYSQGRCPGWGIYLGCETRDSLVVSNVVYGTTESVHVWYKNRNIILENNVFAEGRKSQINYQNPRNLSHENIVFQRNVVYFTDPKSALFRISAARSRPAQSDHNILFCPGECICRGSVISGLPQIDTWEKWQQAGFDIHSIVEEPRFADPENGDYSLKSDSPAFKLGFNAIDLSQVGVRAK